MTDFKSSLITHPLAKSAGTVMLVLLACGGIYLLISSQPSPSSEMVDKGRKLAQSGREMEAAEQWKAAVARDQNCPDAWEELGKYYRDNGDFDSAIEPYRHLVLLKPDMPGVFGMLGSSVVRAKNSEDAYKQALKDIDKNPNDLAALTIASSYLTFHDEQRMHLTYLRRLTQLRPKDRDFLTSLATTLINTHKYEEAGPVLDRLLILSPDNPAAYDLHGQYLLKGVGTPQALVQAESDFLKTLQLNSRSLFPHLNLGRVYIAMGKPEKALEQLKTASELLPFRPDVYFEIARAFTMAHKPDKAAIAQSQFLELRRNDDRASALTKRCTAFPDDFDMHLELARLLIQKGELDKAEFYVNRAIILRPNDSKAKETAAQFTALTSRAGGRP